MKIKSMLFFAVAITFVAAVSYHFGGSMRGTNTTRQSIHTPITETEHSAIPKNDTGKGSIQEQSATSNTSSITSQQTKTTPSPDSYCVVTGILFSEESPSAVINGNIIGEGKSVNGVKVIKIHQDYVEFENASHRWSQKVNRPASANGVKPPAPGYLTGPGYITQSDGKIVVEKSTYYPSTTNGKLDKFSETIATENPPTAPLARPDNSSPYAIIEQRANTLRQRFDEQTQRMRATGMSPDQYNRLLVGMQADYDNENYKLSDISTQLDRIQKSIDDGSVVPDLGKEAMWRLVLPPEHAAAMFPKQKPNQERGRFGSEHTDKKVKRKLIATQQRSIYRNAEPLVSQRNLSETSTKIGNFDFHNFTTSDGQTINGSSTRIGNFDFHNFTTSDGQTINGSSTKIGNFGFHNFTTSDGQTINGSSTKIGNFDFHNFTTSDGRSINGTSTRIGNFTFNNFNDSAGNSINGTTTNLGNTSFSNYSH